MLCGRLGVLNAWRGVRDEVPYCVMRPRFGGPELGYWGASASSGAAR